VWHTRHTQAYPGPHNGPAQLRFLQGPDQLRLDPGLRGCACVLAVLWVCGCVAHL
jgi:hypothetical protein